LERTARALTSRRRRSRSRSVAKRSPSPGRSGSLSQAAGRALPNEKQTPELELSADGFGDISIVRALAGESPVRSRSAGLLDRLCVSSAAILHTVASALLSAKTIALRSPAA